MNQSLLEFYSNESIFSDKHWTGRRHQLPNWPQVTQTLLASRFEKVKSALCCGVQLLMHHHYLQVTYWMALPPFLNSNPRVLTTRHYRISEGFLKILKDSSFHLVTVAGCHPSVTGQMSRRNLITFNREPLRWRRHQRGERCAETHQGLSSISCIMCLKWRSRHTASMRSYNLLIITLTAQHTPQSSAQVWHVCSNTSGC